MTSDGGPDFSCYVITIIQSLFSIPEIVDIFENLPVDSQNCECLYCDLLDFYRLYKLGDNSQPFKILRRFGVDQDCMSFSVSEQEDPRFFFGHISSSDQ